MNFLTGAIIGKDGTSAIYRVKQFNFVSGSGQGGGKISGVITFDW
jgi:hypothetical protein